MLAGGGARRRLGRGPSGPAPTRLLCLGAALLAASLGQRSVAGLDAPGTTGPVHDEVVLVGDPEPDGRGGVRVDVLLDGRRLRGMARASAAGALDDRLAGERVTVVGEVAPPGPAERWLRHRHIAGRLTIETVTGWRAGDGVTRLANGLRRTLARGAAGLPERQRSLLAGVTLGDDRAQPADMTDAFRASGLTHLLAVSGQNVAFVLVIVAPLLTRLRFGPRLGATWPCCPARPRSQVRAIGAAGDRDGLGRRGGRRARPSGVHGADGWRWVSPAWCSSTSILATSLGFPLSVAGATGIVVGAPGWRICCTAPRWLATPLSVTLAAQAAVSPLLVGAFGSVPAGSPAATCSPRQRPAL